jgi:hypothetical protein
MPSLVSGAVGRAAAPPWKATNDGGAGTYRISPSPTTAAISRAVLVGEGL